MRGINQVIIIGRLGADPETRHFSNGGSVTNISVATSEQWTDKNTGEKREATEWHRISLFNRLGEIAAQYLKKGSQVYIEGSLRTRKWQDQNGQDRYMTEIHAQKMQILGNMPDVDRPPVPSRPPVSPIPQPPKEPVIPVSIKPDDIPYGNRIDTNSDKEFDEPPF